MRRSDVLFVVRRSLGVLIAELPANRTFVPNADLQDRENVLFEKREKVG